MNVKNIAALRKLQGYTQQALADKIGITRQQISAIEKGKTLPSVPVAKAIANILGIKWETFFDSDTATKAGNK